MFVYFREVARIHDVPHPHERYRYLVSALLLAPRVKEAALRYFASIDEESPERWRR